MGYFISDLTRDSLLEFALEEYGSVKWDATSMDSDDDFIAVWGWCHNGTYEVALAMLIERSDEEVEEISKKNSRKIINPTLMM